MFPILFPVVLLGDVFYCAVTQMRQGSIQAGVPSFKDTQEKAAALAGDQELLPCLGKHSRLYFGHRSEPGGPISFF